MGQAQAVLQLDTRGLATPGGACRHGGRLGAGMTDRKMGNVAIHLHHQ